MATGSIGTRKAVEYARPDRARPRGRAREGHRPPRPEAREPVPDQGRARQDPRLRDREARAGGRGKGRHRRRDALPHRHEPRHDDGHGRLHVARAGARPADRSPLGPLLLRGRALRDGHRQAGVQGHDRRRHAERDPARGPDRADGQRTRPSAGLAPRRAPLSREEPRGPLPVRARPGLRPRGRHDRVERRDACEPPAPEASPTRGVRPGRRVASGGGGARSVARSRPGARLGLRRRSRS